MEEKMEHLHKEEKKSKEEKKKIDRAEIKAK